MGSEAQWATEARAAGFLQGPREGFSPADFSSLAEHLPHIVWTCRLDGSLDYMNSHGLGYFGSRLHAALREFPAGLFTHPDDDERTRVAWERALQGHEPLSLEARLQRADGAFRWHLIRAEPVTDMAGHLVKWIGISTNVHSVKEGNEFSTYLLELSTDLARMDNPHELVSTAMFRLRQYLGATQVTLAEFDRERGQAVMLRQGRGDGPDLQVLSLPIGPFESLDVEARKGLVTVLRDVPHDTQVARLYNRWCGLRRVGAIVSAPLMHSGSLVASLTVVEDVPRNWTSAEVELTRRVAEIVWPALEKARADHAIAVSEERLRLAQAVAQIGTWELEPVAGWMRFSPESYELFGLGASPQTDLYALWVSLIDPRDQNALREMVDECRAAGTAEAEFRYRHPIRGLRWIHCRAGVIQGGADNSIVGISLDVTERRKAEDALKDVNQRKDEFLAMLAHELRNPLAPIRNAAQILRAHSTGQPELEWARTIIERQTGHLVHLVDDLLEVSRMIRGKIVLQKSGVQLSEFVQHAVDTSQPLIRARKHQLRVSLPSGPVSVDGDLTRLAQALANLLNNAAKYTDEGGQIWLDAWLEGSQVVVRVRDTGPGITPALLPHVFDLFTQAERTLDRAQGGLGIGLTLVKLMVEMHGGTVEARNSPIGHGAEFLVRLPVKIEDASASSGDPAATDERAITLNDTRRMKILVVDDNVDAADSIALLLNIDGFDAQSVHGAMAALDTVDSFRPDVVLLDIGLPVMNGYEVAQRMRKHIPIEQMRIVALSGYGREVDRDKAAQAGFDGYLVKPVEPSALSDFLRAHR